MFSRSAPQRPFIIQQWSNVLSASHPRHLLMARESCVCQFLAEGCTFKGERSISSVETVQWNRGARSQGETVRLACRPPWFCSGMGGGLAWQEFGFYLRCWPRSRSQRGRNEEFGRARLPSGTDSQRPGTAWRFGSSFRPGPLKRHRDSNCRT